jgi:hypothetical protein
VAGFTESFYLEAMADLKSVFAAFKAGQFDEAKVPKNTLRELRSLATALVQERANVDKLRKQVAGSVGAGSELDLGAARDEIGRRLACLRAARGD